MTRKDLMCGYMRLLERIREWPNFELRAKGMISLVRRQPRVRRPRIPWKLKLAVLKLLFFGMDRQARRTALRLFIYTLRRAPFMLPKVGFMILRNHAELSKLPALRKVIEVQVLLESGKGFAPRMEPTVFFVPETFKRPYRTLFAELHKRVYEGLIDKSRTNDALAEVVYDFLTRWGPTFRQFEEHHRAFLLEICDRTISKENGNVRAVERATAPQAEAPDGDYRRSRLPDEILRTVEQQLRVFRGAVPGFDPVAVHDAGVGGGV
jgi:hypothetical protein